jgi:hypothetical protein
LVIMVFVVIVIMMIMSKMLCTNVMLRVKCVTSRTSCSGTS